MPEKTKESINELAGVVWKSLAWTSGKYEVKFREQYSFETTKGSLLVEIILPESREDDGL